MAKTSKSPAKKTSGKKPAAKATAAKKSPAKKPATARKGASRSGAAKKPQASTGREIAIRDPRRTKQISELTAIAERLNDDGLELLLAQAQLIDHKGKIEEFNRQLNVAAARAAAARKAAARPSFDVQVERTKDDFFIIQMDQVRVFFNRGELRELTRICHAAANATAGARRMYAWFAKERSDLLADAGINTERSPYLINLYQIIVSTYTVKK